MAEAIRGQAAIVWGVQGITMTAGIVSGTNAQQVQSITLERTADGYDIKNAAGETIGKVFYNHKKVLRLTVLPTAANISGAQTSWSAHIIAAGTKVTVVDSGSTVLDGDYNILSTTGRGDQTNPRMADIELESFDSYDVTPTIS